MPNYGYFFGLTKLTVVFYSIHGSEILDVAASHDNGRIATAGLDRKVFVTDVSTGKTIRKIRAHDDKVMVWATILIQLYFKSASSRTIHPQNMSTWFIYLECRRGTLKRCISSQNIVVENYIWMRVMGTKHCRGTSGKIYSASLNPIV